MFTKLEELVNSLEVNDTKKYKEILKARKTLQSIKIEAQRLRGLLNDSFKSGKTIDVVKKEEVKEEKESTDEVDVAEKVINNEEVKSEKVFDEDDDFENTLAKM